MAKKSKNKKRGVSKIELKISPKDKGALQKIARKIEELRREELVTQQELAKKIGTTQSAISRIESGKQNITIDYLQRIASALNRDIKVKFIK
ncbi:MAG: helix-turn-helix domain-containing protein [Candidatus Nealsonbacteria bacterium]|nr:helix-turn-helix domain-containing protein [Candidatus Nealsonbacteria bacterium]